MKAVTSALAGGVITPGEAATIVAELAVPDLDLINQGEQGVRDRRERFATGRSGNPASPARLVVDTFVRAIETSDFERRLQQVEADHANPAGAPAGTNGAGPNWFYNPWARFCCRFAAGVETRNNRLNLWMWAAPGGRLGGTAHNPANAMVIPARAEHRWQDRDRNETSPWAAL